MMSFRGNRLAETQLPLGTVWLLEKLAESKGKQALYEKQSPQILRALREMAVVESTTGKRAQSFWYLRCATSLS
jgi:hypothetical protein